MFSFDKFKIVAGDISWFGSYDPEITQPCYGTIDIYFSLNYQLSSFVKVVNNTVSLNNELLNSHCDVVNKLQIRPKLKLTFTV